MTLTIDNYKTFDNVADLNEAIRLHLRNHQYKLNPTAIKTLEVISRHAVKYPGAAWLKVNTLAKLIGKSAPTARRALALLERLGIIERVVFLRHKSGGNGANILRIVADVPADDWGRMIAREHDVEPTERKPEQPKSPTEATILKKHTIKTYNQTLQPLAEPTASFYEHLRELISDKRQRREYITAFKKQTVKLLRFSIYSDKAELLETIAIRSLYITLKREQNSSVGNSIGYFYGTLRNQIDEALFIDIQEVYSVAPNDLLASLPY